MRGHPTSRVDWRQVPGGGSCGRPCRGTVTVTTDYSLQSRPLNCDILHLFGGIASKIDFQQYLYVTAVSVRSAADKPGRL
jgi:hypothetical protein